MRTSKRKAVHEKPRSASRERLTRQIDRHAAAGETGDVDELVAWQAFAESSGAKATGAPRPSAQR